MDLTTLRVANERRAIEWNNGRAVSLSFRGNELAGETGEACNIIKKLERIHMGIKSSAATEDALMEELADVVICADLIAMELGRDLGEATRRKFNATSVKYGLSTVIAE